MTVILTEAQEISFDYCMETAALHLENAQENLFRRYDFKRGWTAEDTRAHVNAIEVAQFYYARYVTDYSNAIDPDDLEE